MILALPLTRFRWLLVAAFVSLPGCLGGILARRNEDEKMSYWDGKNIRGVIREWGAPSRRYEDVYEWDSRHCREWFEVDEDLRIVSWHWHGACRD